MTKKTFAILGSGMQGTAVAYDLCKHSDPAKVKVGDVAFVAAKQSAQRVNDLTQTTLCEPSQVDALDDDRLRKFLGDVDVLVSCVPYWMHPRIAKVAIETKTHMVDMGGNTDITMQTLALDSEAKAAGVSVVPDTGLAPGMVNNLGAYLMAQFDEPCSIKLYCGGLPQHPKPPLNYKLVFNVEGLVAEYSGQATLVRNGVIARADTLSELEELHIAELGKMEAFVTSGGTSTAPHTFLGQVKNYEYKTIRYPGHCEKMRLFRDYGFWGEDPVDLPGGAVAPRAVFHTLMAEALKDDGDEDLIVVRAVGVGKKDGADTTRQIDCLDKQDRETGFSAMERMTGFSTAVIADQIAKGQVPAGCIPYEIAVPGDRYVEEIQKRGIRLEFS